MCFFPRLSRVLQGRREPTGDARRSALLLGDPKLSNTRSRSFPLYFPALWNRYFESNRVPWAYRFRTHFVTTVTSVRIIL